MRKKRRGYSRYFFITLLIVVLLYISYLILSSSVKKMSLFKIKQIEIVGNRNLNKDFLYSLVKDLIGKNLFVVNSIDIKTKFLNIVRIKDIKVKKYPPSRLVIKIRERFGKFYIKTKEGNLVPIDNEKVVLDNERVYPNEVFPIIDTNLSAKKDIKAGKKIKDKFVDRVFAFADTINSIDKNFIRGISEFYKDKSDIVMIDKDNGNRIVFGKGNLKRKLQRYNHLRGLLVSDKKSYKVVLKWNNQAVISSEEN